MIMKDLKFVNYTAIMAVFFLSLWTFGTGTTFARGPEHSPAENASEQAGISIEDAKAKIAAGEAKAEEGKAHRENNASSDHPTGDPGEQGEDGDKPEVTGKDLAMEKSGRDLDKPEDAGAPDDAGKPDGIGIPDDVDPKGSKETGTTMSEEGRSRRP